MINKNLINHLKKIILIISILWFSNLIFINNVNWQYFSERQHPYITNTLNYSDTNLWNELRQAWTIYTNPYLAFLYSSFNIRQTTATWYIIVLINYFLSIVWTVAVLVLIYWFYLMFATDNQSEAFGKAKKYVAISALALFIMWFSWIIVSYLFYIFQSSR